MIDLTHRGRSACAVAALIALSLLFSSVGLSRTASAASGTSYAESVDGDLPENPPRALEFALGANRVQGSVEGGVDSFDSFSFTLAPGEQLDSVILNGFVGDSSNAVRFFTGTDPGADPPAFLGETFMSTARIGSDYLDLVGLGPFGPGVYTISIVGGPGLHSYDFILSVPEPGPAGAAFGLVLGLGTLRSLRRARRIGEASTRATRETLGGCASTA